MLKKFSAKGFKQFQDLSLDFDNVRDYDFNTHCLSPNKQLLKTLLVYGPNASGKSNFGFAVFDIVQHLFDRMSVPEAYENYLNADAASTPAEFFYEFQFPRLKTIRYRYKKMAAKTMVAEEMFYGDQLIFSWNAQTGKDDFSNLDQFGFATLNQQYRDRNISFLRYIANNSALKPNSPVKKVMDFVGSMLWFRRADNGNSFIGLHSQSEKIDQYIIDQNLVKDFEKFLNVHEVHEKLVVKQSPDGQQTIFFDHKRLIPFFSAASSGTVALAILFYWKSFFDKASFIFIDEFDAFYHTKVAENIFDLLTSINKQVVLTTHNTNLLDHRKTRPDCCFEIRSGKLKSLSDRTTRVLREGNNLEKLYLAGEFDE